MAGKRLAISALVGAAALPAWSGLAWADNYTNLPTTGGTSQGETVGHSGGANADQPPMSVTNDRPAPGSPETVSESPTACAPFSPFTTQMTFIGPGSTPVAFGSGNPQTGPSGSISVAGTIPSNAASGIWSIFVTCNDASGNPLVLTATIVVGGGTSSAGVRSSAVSNAAPRSSSAPAGAASTSGSTGGATTVWTPPADWGTPAVRALVVPAVNTAAASAPVVLALGSHPVVAHTPVSPISDAPWRDGAAGLVGVVALLALSKLALRPGHRRRPRRQRSNWKRRHSPLRSLFGGNSKGIW